MVTATDSGLHHIIDPFIKFKHYQKGDNSTLFLTEVIVGDNLKKKKVIHANISIFYFLLLNLVCSYILNVCDFTFLFLLYIVGSFLL